ncbi:MAG: alpha-amylase family glycosyl hydrolase [Bacteroidales bacterium]
MNSTLLINLKLQGIILFLAAIMFSCNQPANSTEEIVSEKQPYVFSTPEWSKNANIYEVNIRQYTKEGTFRAFESHLPRLQNMGVKILWLMPIYPIGEKNRKGSLGSYYAVKDYKAVNPEFGTLEDFKSLVKKAHEMGFKVILDWVANHTAWDNQWIYNHPEWYSKDSLGNMVSPFDWSDVADLNYDEKSLWDAQIDALKFWVTEADVDGYRCDVAGMVPLEFWEKARYELDQIKPVFMLAEAEEVAHHEKSFDMSYAWELHHIFNKIAKGEKNANDLEAYFYKNDTAYPLHAYRMAFITNHDENSWNGTVTERMGEGGEAFTVLTYTLPGMPLIYSGQEVGLNKRLEFFEKDQIDWDDSSPLILFYSKLNQLKNNQKALWNGEYGSPMIRIKTTNDEDVFAFIRGEGIDQIFTIVNLSDDIIETTFSGGDHFGSYQEYFSGEEITWDGKTTVSLQPWEYRVYLSK